MAVSAVFAPPPGPGRFRFAVIVRATGVGPATLDRRSQPGQYPVVRASSMSNPSARLPTSDTSLTARQRSALVLIAATLVTLPFGTIYAFSVLLKPMEQMIGAGRAEMTFVFSAASVCMTAGMLLGPR